MNIRERIRIDLDKFDRLLDRFKGYEYPVDVREVIDLAVRYRRDAEYFLEKGDYYTSFGCIVYAHGLLDGVRVVFGYYDGE